MQTIIYRMNLTHAVIEWKAVQIMVYGLIKLCSY